MVRSSGVPFQFWSPPTNDIFSSMATNTKNTKQSVQSVDHLRDLPQFLSGSVGPLTHYMCEGDTHCVHPCNRQPIYKSRFVNCLPAAGVFQHLHSSFVAETSRTPGGQSANLVIHQQETTSNVGRPQQQATVCNVGTHKQEATSLRLPIASWRQKCLKWPSRIMLKAICLEPVQKTFAEHDKQSVSSHVQALHNGFYPHCVSSMLH